MLYTSRSASIITILVSLVIAGLVYIMDERDRKKELAENGSRYQISVPLFLLQ